MRKEKILIEWQQLQEGERGMRRRRNMLLGQGQLKEKHIKNVNLKKNKKTNEREEYRK